MGCTNPDITFYDATDPNGNTISFYWPTANIFNFEQNNVTISQMETFKMAGNQLVAFNVNASDPTAFIGGGIAFFGTGQWVISPATGQPCNITGDNNNPFDPACWLNPNRAALWSCADGLTDLYNYDPTSGATLPSRCFSGTDAQVPDNQSLINWKYALSTYPCIPTIYQTTQYAWDNNDSFYSAGVMAEDDSGTTVPCTQALNVEWTNPAYAQCNTVWNALFAPNFEYQGIPCLSEYNIPGPTGYTSETNVPVPAATQTSCMAAQANYLTGITQGVCHAQINAVPPSTVNYIPSVMGYPLAGVPGQIGTSAQFCGCNCNVVTQGDPDKVCPGYCAADTTTNAVQVQTSGWFLDPDYATCSQKPGQGQYATQAICQNVLNEYNKLGGGGRNHGGTGAAGAVSNTVKIVIAVTVFILGIILMFILYRVMSYKDVSSSTIIGVLILIFVVMLIIIALVIRFL